MTVAVLDASALLAMLMGKPGGEVVRPFLADSAMSTLNLSEVVGHFARNGAAGSQIRSALDPLPILHVPFDETLAYEAGLMLPATRPAGLSLGDRACLALAGRMGVRAITADRSWVPVGKQLGIAVELIRR